MNKYIHKKTSRDMVWCECHTFVCVNFFCLFLRPSVCFFHCFIVSSFFLSLRKRYRI